MVEGGSTLTQQLAKMLFLRPDKTMERKILEAMMAVQLERRYTKEELFLFYCNQVYLGHGVYGVQAAANYYFGKAAHDLNIPEAALLAALPKAPQDFSPYLHPEKSLQRRNHVLNRMREEGFITQKDYDASVKLPLGVKTQLPKVSVAPYFSEEIRKYLEQKYGYSGIYESGLQIESTVDISMQKIAETALDHGLRKLDKRHGWRKITTSIPPEQFDTYRDVTWTQPPAAGRIMKGIVLSVTDRDAVIRIAGQDVTLPPEGWAWTQRKYATSLLDPGNVTDFLVKEVNDGTITSIVLDQAPSVGGAFVAMEVKTGRILALIGGSDFATKKFDRATQAFRQTGSAFKPFLYAAAFERGYTPSDIMVDKPLAYFDPWTKLTWSPKIIRVTTWGP